MARYVAQVNARCPWCKCRMVGLATEHAEQRLTDEAIVMCYRCIRPSVWAADRAVLLIPTRAQMAEILDHRPALSMWCEAMVRDEYGLRGLFHRAVWPDGWSAEKEEGKS